MKKALSLLLMLVILLSLCACGKNDTQNTDPSTTLSQATTDNAEEPTSGTTEGTQAPTEEPTTPPTEEPTTVPTETPTTKPTETPTTNPTTCSHSYKDATCTAPKTCSKCGATSGSATGHSYKDATCTAPKTCSKCGATSGSATGHSYKDATCTAPKTCSKCGATSGSALGHSYTDATCIAPKTCSKCGATEGGKGSHNYQEGTCSVCGCKQLGYGTWQTFCATGDTRDWMCLFRVRFGDEHTDVVLLDCSAASLYSPEEIAYRINLGHGTVDYQGETYFLEAGESRDCHYEISGDSATIYLDEYLGEEANGLPGKMTLKLSGKDQATVTEITGFDFNGLFGFQGITENMVFTCLD